MCISYINKIIIESYDKNIRGTSHSGVSFVMHKVIIVSKFSEYIDIRNNNRKFYMRAKWRKTRQQVLARDHYECVRCKEEGKLTINQHQSLEVDHILELETHPELAYELDNLQTLCKYHHNKKHGRFEFNPNRKEIKYNDEQW